MRYLISDVFSAEEGTQVEIWGWIYRTRCSGGMAFVVVRDSTGVIQVTVKKNQVDKESFAAAEKALVESSVKIRGTVKDDLRAPGGKEVLASKFEVVSYAEVFPITKDKSDEFLLDNRHLWIRSMEMNAVLKIRDSVIHALREFFRERGFIETHAPTFVSGACEGGATLFEVPYFDKKKVYLTQSWQLYAEAMAMGLERIYTLAPSFRAEKSRTRRHLTEFWHFEVEVAWAEHEDIIKLEEEAVDYALRRVLKEREKELTYLKRDLKTLKAIEPPYPRMKYSEVVEELDLEYGTDLGYSEEALLTRSRKEPLFVTHYPKEVKAFYHRPDPENRNVVLCNDLLAPEGYGEIIGGGERIWHLEELLERMKEEHMDIEQYKWYIDIRRYGSVPHSGFGLGLDRTVAWIAGSSHIKYVIPFPRTPRRVYP